jgi:hypothetical protein
MEGAAMTTQTLGPFAARRGAADLLCLAATPVFAAMALLAALPDAAPAMQCGAMHDASPLGGMTWMYLLMSVFHSAPWLRLLAGRR